MILSGAVTQIQQVVCQNAAFAGNPYCKSHSIWKGILSSVLPPLLLTLWQNLCMPQLIYRGAQVLSAGKPLLNFKTPVKAEVSSVCCYLSHGKTKLGTGLRPRARGLAA